jgi:hypothetical protein
MAEDLAHAVGALYEQAELALLERLRAALAADIDAPWWVERKLAAVGDLQQGLRELLAGLQTDTDGALREAIAQAYERGQQAAVAELGALPIGQTAAAAEALPGAAVIDRLAAAVVADTGPVYQRVLRVGLDVYRQTVAEASVSVLVGAETRRQAAARALARFATKGVTGFVDKAGRAWDMTSYAEMATRSAVGKAAVQAHTDRLEAAGINLVVVSDSPEECPLCRPWERKVLSIGGSGARDVQLQHATDDGQTVTVHIAGSLADARAAGLQHPNCRHRVSAYLPGITRRPPVQEDRATYEQTQQQRYLERQIRSWKRRAAAAMDDDQRKAANAKVREYQGRVRDLLAESDGLPRKSHREQLSSAR